MFGERQVEAVEGVECVERYDEIADLEQRLGGHATSSVAVAATARLAIRGRPPPRCGIRGPANRRTFSTSPAMPLGRKRITTTNSAPARPAMPAAST